MREGYGVGLWKEIRSGWEAFNSRTRFMVGNGRGNFGRIDGVVIYCWESLLLCCFL